MLNANFYPHKVGENRIRKIFKVSIKKNIWIIAVFIICVSYYLLYYSYGISLSDEGMFVNSSLRILEGQIPYLDFSYYPPALNYIMAIIFKLFGVNILYERLLWVFIISSGVIMTLKLSRSLMGFPFWTLPPLLFLIVPGPWHKSMMPALFLLAIIVCNNYINNKSKKTAYFCGLMAGVAFYFRFDTSFFILISSLLIITATNFLKRSIVTGGKKKWAIEEVYCLAGTTTTIFPALIAILYLQWKTNFIQNFWLRATQEHKTMGFPFPKIDLSTISIDPSGFYFNILFYFPPSILFLILIIIILRYYRSKNLGNEDILVFLLWLFGLFSYNQTIVRTDYAHLLQSVQIPYILSVYFFWLCFRAAGRAKAWRKYAIKASIVILVLFSCGTYVYLNVARGEFYGGTIGNIKNKTSRLMLPDAHVFLEPSDAHEIEDVVAFVREKTSPDDPILVLPYEPMFYVLTERRNPTHYDGVFPSTLSGPRMETAYLKRIKNSDIKLIIYSDTKFTDNDKSRFSVYDKGIYDFIKSNYRLVKIIGNYQIYLK